MILVDENNSKYDIVGIGKSCLRYVFCCKNGQNKLTSVALGTVFFDYAIVRYVSRRRRRIDDNEWKVDDISQENEVGKVIRLIT